MSVPKEPGGQTPQPVELLNVEQGHVYVVRFLGAYTGTTFHYTRDGLVPCDGEGTCPKSLHALREQWRGWAPVELLGSDGATWWPKVLVITEYLEEQLHGRALRGEVWALDRVARKKGKGKVRGTFVERRDATGLRPPFDLLPVLLRALRVVSLRLGVANPIPPRLYLSPVEGTAPEVVAELLDAGRDEPEAATSEDVQKLLQRAGWKRLGGVSPSTNGAGKGVQHG